MTANPFYGLQRQSRSRVTMQNLAAHPGFGIFLHRLFHSFFQKTVLMQFVRVFRKTNHSVICLGKTIQWYVWVKTFVKIVLTVHVFAETTQN